MQQLFNKLDPIFYCTCQETCRRQACIINGEVCFYFTAKTRRQLSEGAPP